MTRLHLLIPPYAMVALSDPGTFKAPADFRLTLLHDGEGSSSRNECDSFFFVACHMMTLPFQNQGKVFENVVRLQLNELNEDHFGLSLEQMTDLLQSLPHLRCL